MAKCRGLTEKIEPTSARFGSVVKHPNSLIYGIRWPANRLTHGQLQTLRTISKDVRLPITQLLKDAVDIYLFVLQREVQAMMVSEQPGKHEVSGESDVPVPDGPGSDCQDSADARAADATADVSSGQKVSQNSGARWTTLECGNSGWRVANDLLTQMADRL